MSPAAVGTAADPLALLTAYQQSAIVATACLSGVADALHDASSTAAETARAAGTDGRATRMLLHAMVVLGLAERDGDRFRLTESGGPLAAKHPETVAWIVRKEWFFYRVWSDLPSAIADGHARIAPWRERLASDPETAHGFLRALDDLAARFGGELPCLASLAPGTRLLDAGGGAGSHSARLVAEVEGLRATVLDLPGVEPVLRERHPELEFVAGDLDAPRFGRPGGERWDAVLLGNVIHDNPPERCAAIIAEAAVLLEPGGALVLYEWVLDEERETPPDVALFALMMLVENEGGNAYTEEEIRPWLEATGLVDIEVRRGAGPIAAVVARRER